MIDLSRVPLDFSRREYLMAKYGDPCIRPYDNFVRPHKHVALPLGFSAEHMVLYAPTRSTGRSSTYLLGNNAIH